MAARKNIAETVRELIAPTADSLGYLLWDVEYVKEGADMILRVTIDSDEGISLDDCERMTRAIDPILDEADPIDESYNLEVSSPGIERTLTRPDHFVKMAGSEVEIRLFAPLAELADVTGGTKTVHGTLVRFDPDNETIFVEVESSDGEKKTAAIPHKAVSKAQTVYHW